jgi:capsular polysaccharide transport system ATP-binding protein
MISFHDVRKTYPATGGRRIILRNASFLLPDGINLGVIGASGSGKSTLIRLIAGTEFADSGKIIRTGRISWPLGLRSAFDGNLTGRQNVQFVATAYGCDYRAMLDFVQEFSELGAYIDLPVDEYSAGMRQRFAFGLTMAVQFDTYLVDEIISVGDPRTRRLCEMVFASRAQRANVIMVSDDASDLRRYCQMGAVLDRGEIQFFTSMEDAIQAGHEFLQTRPRRKRRWRTE